MVMVNPQAQASVNQYLLYCFLDQLFQSKASQLGQKSEVCGEQERSIVSDDLPLEKQASFGFPKIQVLLLMMLMLKLKQCLKQETVFSVPSMIC